MTWGLAKVQHRGYACGYIPKAQTVNEILEYVAQYAPGHLHRCITREATSLESAFNFVRTWAGVSRAGSAFQTFIAVRDSFHPSLENSIVDHYYYLRSALEDSTLKSATSGGKISFEGTIPDQVVVKSLSKELYLIKTKSYLTLWKI